MNNNPQPNNELDELLDCSFKENVDMLAKIAFDAGYASIPPTIDEFLNDKYYAGSFLGGNKLFPTWREQLRDIYPTPFTSPFLQIAVTGAIGLGKSTFCMAGVLYDLCRLLHLKNPHKTYHLIESDRIVIAFMNTTMRLADSVLYRQFKDWLHLSPYFREQLKKVPQRDDGPPKLPHNIVILSGSRETHVLGQAIVAGILSELNYQGEHQKEQAFKQYQSVLSRMESRFMRGEGLITPGRLWLDSSKSDEMGFLERHLKKAKEDPLSLVVEKAHWEIMVPAGKLQVSGKKFQVFIGDQNRDPFILEETADKYNIEPNLIIDIPIEYKDAFVRDIYTALRDKAGVSTWSSHKFLPQASIINRALALDNPCYKVEVEVDFDDKSDDLINYIDLNKLERNFPYFVHLDLGIRVDRTGIAFTRGEGEVAVNRTDSQNLTDVLTSDLSFVTDLVMAVIPKPGKEVPLSRLKKFMVDLSHAGIEIAAISMDGYQSKNLIQDWVDLGYDAALLSVDINRDAYDHLKNCMNEERWRGPDHPILRKEFINLIDVGKKIDHPPIEGQIDKAERPSKDMTDAVAGSVWNCFLKSARGKGITAMENFVDHISAANADNDIKEEIYRLYNDSNKGFW